MVFNVGTLVLTWGCCPNTGENREENVMEVFRGFQAVIYDTEYIGADGSYAQPIYTGYVGVSWELCKRCIVGSFGDAGGNAGDAAAWLG